MDNEKRMVVIREEILEEPICAICKLAIGKEQIAFQCLICQTNFHGIHLSVWLQRSNNCPVCKKRIYLRQENKMSEKQKGIPDGYLWFKGKLIRKELLAYLASQKKKIKQVL